MILLERMLGEFATGPVRGGVAVQRDGMRPSRMHCRVKDWRGADAFGSARNSIYYNPMS